MVRLDIKDKRLITIGDQKSKNKLRLFFILDYESSYFSWWIWDKNSEYTKTFQSQ